MASCLEQVVLCRYICTSTLTDHFDWLPGGGGGIGAFGGGGGGGAAGAGGAAAGGGAAAASKISSNLMSPAPPPSFSAVSIASHFLCSNSFCGRG